MPDGSSGLSLSEMGITAVKKTVGGAKKAIAPVGQQVKQQLAGTFVPGQSPQASSAQPPSEKGIGKIGGGSFDIAAAAKSAKQQMSGTGTGGNTIFQPQAAQPPSEAAPKQAGGFDMSSMFGETNPFGAVKPKQFSPQQQAPDPQLAAQLEKQKAQDQQQVEALRKKLHSIYFEEFQKKAEGQDAQKQQEEKKRMESQQQDEEEKKQQKEQLMEPIAMAQGPQKGMAGMEKKKNSGFSLMKLLKPKQGSHEGRSGKG